VVGARYPSWTLPRVTLSQVLIRRVDGHGLIETDETTSFLPENDDWNAEGGMGGKENNRSTFTGNFTGD